MHTKIDLLIEDEFFRRILKLQERRSASVTGSEIAYEALNIGLNALESTLDELESPAIFEAAAAARKV